MKRSFCILISLVLILQAVFTVMPANAAVNSQTDPYAEKAIQILASMTPEERVGQVFLVSFEGTNTGIDSNIQDLILNKYIGGVVLRRDNNNFIGPENTNQFVKDLTTSLQSLNAHRKDDQAATLPFTSFAPLLVGISQPGDLSPYDQILNGLTPLPDEMAIGATWDTENARTVGSILGREMKGLGVNLVIGPSLDVLDTVRPDIEGSMGVGTFGGDPYWVGEMGKAYVQGVHEGSENQVAVIATHFPGRGGSDRRPDEEVATVRKSLEQLKQIELAPFFAVTGNAETPEQTVDGLYLSHIRYQGFQGNIRATTKPVSFDQAALEQIMALSEFAGWRQSKGIIVSEDLGSEAVRKFFDPVGGSLDARQVAKSALLAGNDLIYLGNIISSTDTDFYTTTVRTIDFFVQKYQEDSAFQTRLDQAVLKVLTLKCRLFPDFSQFLQNQATDNTTTLTLNPQVQVAEIAQQAATLISPNQAEIDSMIPNPPGSNDRIIFISDKIVQKQCTLCAAQTIFPADILRSAAMRFYGPGTGDLVQDSHLTVYSFDDLKLMLDEVSGNESVRNDLASADWVVFSFTEFQKTRVEAITFQRLFSGRPELIRNKRIIGFAFNAPYFLDATDISKFTAYYGLYSKTPAYFDVAARVLFQEFIPGGDLPVSVSGIGYDLITATSPDPDQVIALYAGSPVEGAKVTETASNGTISPVLYKEGDLLPVQTGVIIDRNGHPVPDGTVVRFIVESGFETGTAEQIESQTKDGVAAITYRIPSLKVLELRVVAEPAHTSQILRLDVTAAGGVITSFEPTVAPTFPQEETETTQPSPTQIPVSIQRHDEGKLIFFDWLVSTILIFGFCLVFNWIARKVLSMKWNIRSTLAMGGGGFIGYSYLGLGLPKAETLIKASGTSIVILAVLTGMGTGLILAMFWYWLEKKRQRLSEKRDQKRNQADTK